MPIHVDVLSVVPKICESYIAGSIVGRAVTGGQLSVQLVDPRQWAEGKYRKVDDRPYGGGPGMVLMAPPMASAIDHCRARGSHSRLLMTHAAGRRLDQAWAQELAAESHLIIVCGHYEGVDERIAELYQPELISIGDVVLTGGELAALTVIDAVARLLPGVLGNAGSAVSDSFADGVTIDHPCYTRPPEFRGLTVPPELVQGDHAAIARWRAEQRRKRTQERLTQ